MLRWHLYSLAQVIYFVLAFFVIYNFFNTAFPVSIFFIQIFYNAFNSPDKFTILKGKVRIRKELKSHVKVLQHVDELIEKEKRDSRKGQKELQKLIV